MITKTIGGDRVGSGRKMKAHLNNYYRSTHNLSEKFASSMGSGILYPAMCKIAMRGDSFDIAINADARTIPTQGPLFGSYKMQVDVYQCPVRLYQALLHNNPTAIGLNMAQIKFPTIELICKSNNTKHFKMNNSSLLKYLGLSGMGLPERPNGGGEWIHPEERRRQINAIPMLAYYDIFKNYYANKQEEKGYVISVDDIKQKNPIELLQFNHQGEAWQVSPYNNEMIQLDGVNHVKLKVRNLNNYTKATILDNLYCRTDEMVEFRLGERGILTADDGYNDVFYVDWTPEEQLGNEITGQFYAGEEIKGDFASPIKINEFPLENIDNMRYQILTYHVKGRSLNISQGGQYVISPYKTNYEYVTYRESEGTPQEKEFYIPKNYFAENGLVLKTYQNDIFNNWLNSDWIEGENGISELTKVSVENGEFSMDALSFATKLYNMLNRVVLSGNTYEDWQDVVYEEVKRRQVESPIYCGGMSQEIYFDEIVQTAPADGDPLGTLGGRGRLSGNKKGGKLHIKCDEACFIIAIVSLTPRIFYTQGNEFYLTDVFSMDDLHKPAMDGIGFQDLIGERMAWFDTILGADYEDYAVKHRSKIGKVPAWIEYMTSVDKAYGDFADTDGKGYMILNRNYEMAKNERGETIDGIGDATTYIDPAKYNYAFAYTELEAQNFWVEIAFNIKARRLMSARLMPHV